MTKLPANIEDAKALIYAREIMRGQVDGYDWFDSSDNNRFFRDQIKLLANLQPTFLIQTVEDARNGWTVAHEALREMILEHQNSRQPMPTYLEAYAMYLVENGVPKKLPGQRKEANILRDIAITCSVLMVSERFNMRPTRNPTTKKRASGCSIVAEASGLTESDVISIWGRYGWALKPGNIQPSQ